MRQEEILRRIGLRSAVGARRDLLCRHASIQRLAGCGSSIFGLRLTGRASSALAPFGLSQPRGCGMREYRLGWKVYTNAKCSLRNQKVERDQFKTIAEKRIKF
jgi:hypothetical protein